MDSRPAIQLTNVSKQFQKYSARKEMTTLKSELVRLVLRRKKRKGESGVIPALRDISLTVPKGGTVGIIGRNGSGKSTLLKLITGIYSPTGGSIEVNGRISALLELGAGFHPDFTGRENILINGIILGMSARDVKERIAEIIEFSELGDFIDEPVRTYSSGMFMRLAFSVATHVDPEILIVDEILAVGDAHFGRKSLAKMMEFKARGKTIVMVTHDLGTLQKWCDTAAWIDGGVIRRVGPPREVVDEYQQALALAESRGGPLLVPALAPDGGALPQVAPKDAANSTGEISLTEIALFGRGGATAEHFDTEDPLSIRIGFSCAKPLATASFAVKLTRADGSEVYSTSTHAEQAPLPNPLPERGTVTLHLERLGLLGGQYKVGVSALTTDGRVLANWEHAKQFGVSSTGKDTGLVRPVHRWSAEEAVVAPPAKLATGS